MSTPITNVTSEQLSQIYNISLSLASSWQPHIQAAMTQFEINTLLRVSAFLAQIGHESGRLSTAEENLNYSASGLLTTFPKYFTSETANAYARQPEKIANRVYGNRYGNGNEASGDGWRYHGRGLIQITFKDNYYKISQKLNLNLILNPELLLEKSHAAMSAAAFWDMKNLNGYADRNLFDKTTKIINGGYNGKADRDELYNRALAVLSGKPVETNIKDTVEPDNTHPVYNNFTPLPDKANLSEANPTSNSIYPNNLVYETPAGHIIELDDSPGNERIHIFHVAGSYILIDALGNVTIKSVNDRYDYTVNDKNEYIGGNETRKIAGNSYTKASGNATLNADGDAFITASSVQLNAPDVNFSDNLTGNNADFENLTVSNVITGSIDFALLAGDIGFGGSGGTLGDILEADGSGNPVFTAPVTMAEPMTLGGVRLQVFADGGNMALCYFHNGQWYRVKNDTVLV